MGSAKKNAQSMESCFREILCFQDLSESKTEENIKGLEEARDITTMMMMSEASEIAS